MRSTSRASCSFPTAATTRQAPPAAAIRGALREVPPNLLDVVVCGDSAEAGIDTALRRHGTPNTIVATPFVPLPKMAGEADEKGAPGEEALTGRLSLEGFRDVVQDNLTHLFRIARKASPINGCQLVLCSPEVPAGSDPHDFGFAPANFRKTTLDVFAATLAAAAAPSARCTTSGWIACRSSTSTATARPAAGASSQIRRAACCPRAPARCNRRGSVVRANGPVAWQCRRAAG